jgi:uncharacterized protein YbaA (DUF1428 family)
MIYEVRDYHYRTDQFDAYKAWAEKAAPVLKKHLDVVGFWVDTGAAPEVRGSDPIKVPQGYANVTWIIRWPSKELRDIQLPKALDHPEWKAMWNEHPNPRGYVQLLSRFMRGM